MVTNIRVVPVLIPTLLVLIAALPSVPAPTLPTPGWVSIHNDLSQLSGGGCAGDIYVTYALRPTDVASGVRVTPDANCTLGVQILEADTQVVVLTSGTVSTRAEWWNSVTANYLETLGTTCTRVSGAQGVSEYEDWSAASGSPATYGSGCAGGYTQTFTTPFNYFGTWLTVTEKIWAGLAQFGVPYCHGQQTVSNGEYRESMDCFWDDSSTVSYTVNTPVVAEIEMGQIDAIEIE